MPSKYGFHLNFSPWEVRRCNNLVLHLESRTYHKATKGRDRKVDENLASQHMRHVCRIVSVANGGHRLPYIAKPKTYLASPTRGSKNYRNFLLTSC